jgi:hypothetical protein
MFLTLAQNILIANLFRNQCKTLDPFYRYLSLLLKNLSKKRIRPNHFIVLAAEQQMVENYVFAYKRLYLACIRRPSINHPLHIFNS